MNAAVAVPVSRPERELDDVILTRARDGDDAAFRTLIERYQDAVFALLWRFFGRRARSEIIEDVAQETFLGVYRSLARFRPEGPARLSTWILTIATRAAIKATRAHVPSTTPIDEHVDELATPAVAVPDRAFIEALGRALTGLAEPYRIVFVLRAYHDFSYEEIAEALDVDVGTVKSRLSRARTQLQTDLQEFEP